MRLRLPLLVLLLVACGESSAPPETRAPEAAPPPTSSELPATLPEPAESLAPAAEPPPVTAAAEPGASVTLVPPTSVAAAPTTDAPCTPGELREVVPILVTASSEAAAFFDDDATHTTTLGRVRLFVPADAHVDSLVLTGVRGARHAQIVVRHGDEEIGRADARAGVVTLSVARSGGRIELASEGGDDVSIADLSIRGCPGATVRVTPRPPAVVTLRLERAPSALERTRWAPDRAEATTDLDSIEPELAALFGVETRALGRLQLRARAQPPMEIVLALSRGPEEATRLPADLASYPLLRAAPTPVEPPTEPSAEPVATPPPVAIPPGQQWRTFVGRVGDQPICVETSERSLSLVRIVRSEPATYDVIHLDSSCEVLAASMHVGDLDADGWPEVRVDVQSIYTPLMSEDAANGTIIALVDLATWLPELLQPLTHYEGNDYAYESRTLRVSLADLDGDGRRDVQVVGHADSFDLDSADEEEENPRPVRTAVHDAFVYDAEADAFSAWTAPPTPPAPTTTAPTQTPTTPTPAP